MVSSDLMEPRILRCMTISRSPRSAALLVGGMRGSRMNRNRSSYALPSLVRNFCKSSQSVRILRIPRMRLKSVEQVRARTGSRNHSIRVFMFFLFMTVCNLWYTAVQKMNDMMETRRRRRVKINITSDVFLALLIVLVKKIITSVNKELEYYLQCVR